MRKGGTHCLGRVETTGDMELGRPGTRLARAAGDRGPPAGYGGRARGLELEDIAEGVAGLVLDGDYGPVGVVEEGVCDLWEHGSRVGIQARCSLGHWMEETDGRGRRTRRGGRGWWSGTRRRRQISASPAS